MQKGNDQSPYTLDFLIEAGREIVEEGKSTAKVAERRNISPGTASKGRAAYRAYKKGKEEGKVYGRLSGYMEGSGQNLLDSMVGLAISGPLASKLTELLEESVEIESTKEE